MEAHQHIKGDATSQLWSVFGILHWNHLNFWTTIQQFSLVVVTVLVTKKLVFFVTLNLIQSLKNENSTIYSKVTENEYDVAASQRIIIHGSDHRSVETGYFHYYSFIFDSGFIWFCLCPYWWFCSNGIICICGTWNSCITFV